jgi:protein-S-isoprenylcysteine O-methyltransferase Ste14
MYVGFALWTLGAGDPGRFCVDAPRRAKSASSSSIASSSRCEERHLERKFGDEYLNYKRRVWRWI